MFFLTLYRPGRVGLTQPPIQRAGGAHSLGLKLLCHKVDYSPPHATEIKDVATTPPLPCTSPAMVLNQLRARTTNGLVGKVNPMRNL
jgi:hypothetical protein